MLKYAKKTNAFILDTLFPVSCILCQKENTWLCPECGQKINLLSFQLCPYCEKEITQNGCICEKCKAKQLKNNTPSTLNALLCATEYQPISKLVHLFKYNFISELGTPLGKIITRIILKNNLPIPELIIPIPIHKRKLKWRGFNQAEILAQVVSQNLKSTSEIPIRTDLVYRKKYTQAQMEIKTYQERLNNLFDAFALFENAQKIINGKSILLIDDIATTGTTLFECAKILKSAGTKNVYGAIIARQKINPQN